MVLCSHNHLQLITHVIKKVKNILPNTLLLEIMLRQYLVKFNNIRL